MPDSAGDAFVSIHSRLAPGFATSLSRQVTSAIGVAEKGFTGLGKSLTSIGGGLSTAGKRLQTFGSQTSRYLTLPIVGAGVAAFKMALDFDKAFTRIAAISNAQPKLIAEWRKQIQGLATDTAQDPTKLANALYFLASAGLKAGQVFPTLRAAAKASAVGLGETADVAKILAQVLNAYAGTGLTAARATDTLVAAVRAGTADPDEFATALGRVLPIAAKAGVSFDQVTASLAALSNIGLSVDEGTTAIRGVLLSLEAPGSQAAKTLKSIGISANEMRAAIADKGLLGALQLLETRTGGNIDTMRKIIPNVRALTADFGLTGKNAKTVADIFEQVKISSGSLDKAFKTTAAGPAFQFQQSLTRLKNTAINLGNTLIPIFTRDIAPAIQKAAKWFNNLSDSQRELLVKVGLVAAALGPASSLIGGLLRLVSIPFKAAGAISGLIGKLLALGKVKVPPPLPPGFPGLPGVPGGAAAGGAAGAAEGVAGGIGAALVAPVVAVGAGFALGAIGARSAQNAWHQTSQKIADDLKANGGDFQKWSQQANASVTAVQAKWTAVGGGKGGQGIISATIQGDKNAIKDGISQYRAWERQIFSTGAAQLQFEGVMKRAKGITVGEATQIAGLINGLHLMGGALNATQRFQVRNLLSAGDFTAALRILQGAVRSTTKGLGDNRTAHKRAADAAEDQKVKVNGLTAAMRQYNRTPALTKQFKALGIDGIIHDLSVYLSLLSQLQKAGGINVSPYRVLKGEGIVHGQHGFEGVVTKPTMFMAGEKNTREQVSIRPENGRTAVKERPGLNVTINALDTNSKSILDGLRWEFAKRGW